MRCPSTIAHALQKNAAPRRSVPGQAVRALWLVLALGFIAVFGWPAFAQGSTTMDEASQQNIEELIDVLEDPQRRQAFVSKLNSLQAAQGEGDGGDSLEISSALQLDRRVGEFLKEYVGLFADSQFQAGSVGKIVSLAAITLLAALFAFLNSWLSRFLDRRVNPFRRRFGLSKNRFSGVFKWQRIAGYILAVKLWLYAVLVVIFDHPPGGTLMQGLLVVIQTAMAVLLVLLLFLLIWESMNAVIESMVERKTDVDSRRALTLLPVVRNVFTFVIVLLSSLVILSELGIDVMPLLAGAGVVGIAVGFGAQTLVKDFLTGFTIIIEDLLQVDDVVTVAGRTGFVSKISMRKIELRSLEGTVHTVPFSAIDIVDNLTKDFSYYMLDIGVAYRENTDEVIDCLRHVDEEMRASDEFGGAILEPLEVLGVDAFADSAVIVKARTKTLAREKWRVGREFNRRIKLVFDERDIEIPFPHQTIYFGVDKEGGAPPIPPLRKSQAES